MKLKNVLIGCDPEVFIKNESDIISAIPFIPGSKENPYPISDYGHFIQTDNIMAEFCVPPVELNNPKEMYQNIKYCLDYIDANTPEGHYHSIKASAFISDEYLADPLAQVFGCDPSFNAWRDGEQNVKPKSKRGLRTCGETVCHLN